jgi:hypothetical protein
VIGSKIPYHLPSKVHTSTIQFLWWGLPIQEFLGPGWGEVLILSEFILEYPHVHLQKKHTSEHPLPDLRPDLQSEANFRLEQTFKIFKNLQKHIPASGVCEGHSTCTSLDPDDQERYIEYSCTVCTLSVLNAVQSNTRVCAATGACAGGVT